MSPVRLWHLMVLTVYVAVGLAVFRFSDSLYRLGDEKNAFFTVLLIPWIFALVSACILPASPHRDWLVALLLSIGGLPWVLTMPLVPFVQLQPRVPARPLVAILLLPIHLLPLAGLRVLAREHLAPERCPGCKRKRLVRSLLRKPRGRPMQLYLRCGCCDAEHLLPVPGAACPDCGRPTMMYRPYVFWWCSCCKARYKRLRRRDWEDASGPEDDRFYWLWDPLQALRRLRSIGRQDQDS